MYINSMKLFNAVHVIQKYYSYSVVYYIVKVYVSKNILAINETASAMSIICFLTHCSCTVYKWMNI